MVSLLTLLSVAWVSSATEGLGRPAYRGMQAAVTTNIFFMAFLLLAFHIPTLEQQGFEVPKERRNKAKIYECEP
jgi:hypothetical protein